MIDLTRKFKIMMGLIDEYKVIPEIEKKIEQLTSINKEQKEQNLKLDEYEKKQDLLVSQINKEQEQLDLLLIVSDTSRSRINELSQKIETDKQELKTHLASFYNLKKEFKILDGEIEKIQKYEDERKKNLINIQIESEEYQAVFRVFWLASFSGIILNGILNSDIPRVFEGFSKFLDFVHTTYNVLFWIVIVYYALAIFGPKLNDFILILTQLNMVVIDMRPKGNRLEKLYLKILKQE